jgi:uncharacterized damage-inducible protein DinB
VVVAVEFPHGVLQTIFARLSRAAYSTISIPIPVTAIRLLDRFAPNRAHLGDRAMELNNIRQLYDYNRWADRRILTVASILASDDFIRPMGNSFSSVRDTLAHILSAEWIWLERWQGRSPKALLDAATFPTVQSLESRWEIVEHDQTQFIEALTPQRLGEELAYINQKGQHYSYPLWQQMVHVVNHSSYHRGQVTTLLRQLGTEAVSTDFLVHYDEKQGRT